MCLVPGGTLDRIPGPAFAGALRGARLPASAEGIYSNVRADASSGDMLAALESHGTCRIPTLRFTEQRVAASAPVWLYNFSWSSPWSQILWRPVESDGLMSLQLRYPRSCAWRRPKPAAERHLAH